MADTASQVPSREWTLDEARIVGACAFNAKRGTPLRVALRAGWGLPRAERPRAAEIALGRALASGLLEERGRRFVALPPLTEMAGAAASKAWWTHHHSVDDDEDSEHTCEDESDCEEAWDRHVLAQFASLPAVDSSWRAPEGALRRARAGRLAGDAVMVPVQFLAIPVTVLIMLVMVPVVLVVALVKKVRRAGPA